MFNVADSSDDKKIKWEGSQADFISLVSLFDALFSLSDKNVPKTADEIGELFLKVIDIDLSPYSDFSTMRLSLGKPETKDIAEKALVYLNKGRKGKNQILNWMETHDFFNKLGKHIDLAGK